MLSNLIGLLSKDKVYLKSTLVDKLGVDEKMVDQLVHELARLGYVENISRPSGAGSCNNCTSQCISKKTFENQSIMWLLTEKGRDLAEKNIL